MDSIRDAPSSKAAHAEVIIVDKIIRAAETSARASAPTDGRARSHCLAIDTERNSDP